MTKGKAFDPARSVKRGPKKLLQRHRTQEREGKNYRKHLQAHRGGETPFKHLGSVKWGGWGGSDFQIFGDDGAKGGKYKVREEPRPRTGMKRKEEKEKKNRLLARPGRPMTKGGKKSYLTNFNLLVRKGEKKEASEASPRGGPKKKSLYLRQPVRANKIREEREKKGKEIPIFNSKREKNSRSISKKANGGNERKGGTLEILIFCISGQIIKKRWGKE